MGTRLSVIIETKHWNPDDLKQAIHQIDEDDSGEGKGIAPENVTAWDIIQYVTMGELAFDGVVDSKIEYIPD